MTNYRGIKATSHLNQGAYAKRTLNRSGITPILGSEVDSAYVIQNTFGQLRTKNNYEPFDDITAPSSSLMVQGVVAYYASTENHDISDYHTLDGIIEPFVIRAQATFTSIDAPFESHTVRANLCNGHEDVFRTTSVVEQTFSFVTGSSTSPFVDGSDVMGAVPYGVKIDGVISHDEKLIVPFSDVIQNRANKFGVTLTGQLKDVILSGSSIDEDSDLRRDQRFAGTGFTYTKNIPGTDSIAFGDLKRG